MRFFPARRNTRPNCYFYPRHGPELLADGDMEAVGVAAWTVGSSATLTKETGTPHGGIQCLRIAYNGVSAPYAYDAGILTIGKTYRARGWARGDGTFTPRLENSGIKWQGTPSTSWQYFDVIFIAVSGSVVYRNDANAAGYCEFDDCSVVEVNTQPTESMQNASRRLNQVEFSTTDTASLSITTRGPADTGFWIDWGDGNREWVAHLGTGTDVVTAHNYGGLVGTKKILLEGVLNDITKFLCTDPTFGGKINALSVMNKLTAVDVGASSLTGTLASLAGQTGLTSLDLAGTGVIGDVSDIITLTALATLTLNSNTFSYTTASLPPWTNATIGLQDNAMTQSEVDNFIIDLDTAGGINGTLNIAGTNAARSSASDAAKASLLGKGWAITVNE